jgi:hypothetical protein
MSMGGVLAGVEGTPVATVMTQVGEVVKSLSSLRK